MFKKRLALFLLPVVLIATMAYAHTRDWDEADPIDHTLNSKWPAEIREVMVDVSERLTNWVEGFATGETTIGANWIPFIEQAAAPTEEANKILCYGKEASSKTELFCKDEDGDEIQFTSGGALNVANACTTVYPVGSIYIATVSTDPSTLLGCGTWAAWGAGRVIVGLNSGDADFDTSEETGGSKTVSVAHTHSTTTGGPSATVFVDDNSGGSDYYVGSQTHTHTGTSGAMSANATPSIVQPYIVAYMWERTS